MIAAAFGDIVGSAYERRRIKTTDFPLLSDRSRYTDDTVCTAAIAYALKARVGFGAALRKFVLRYPKRGYGGMFERWAKDESRGPYQSWGNGAAMRVSPVAHFTANEEEVLSLARESAVVTHDHPEAVDSAQAVALAIWLGRSGVVKEEVRRQIEHRFGYDLRRSIADVRRQYGFEVRAALSVPEAIICALDSRSVEDAVRLAVSLGGDADTQASIAAAIAEAFSPIEKHHADLVRGKLPPFLLAQLEIP